MKRELTDQELLTEVQRRFDKNKQMLEEERKLIQQLNEVNQRLLDSERVKTNFLSNIRNEINNPLASILELSKNIMRGQVEGETLTACATMINAEAFELDFQLRNIFVSAEIEAGEAPLSVISLDINSIVKSVLDAYKNKLSRRSISLKQTNSIADGTIFKSDSEKLHLIISNVVSNAIQFNHDGGEVEVITKMEEGLFILSVRDTGIGIDPSHQEEIYNRFYQVESGSTKRYMGHGLGLTVTKALLEMINGTISVHSVPGEGSVFTIVVNELESVDQTEDIFSADGNDFLFDQEDDMLF
jgi:signal transduction histidine kinase